MADTILSNRWTVTYLTENRQKTIRRDTTVSPTTIDSVNSIYSALQDLFDESAQMDDGVPMSAQTPTEYTIGLIDAGDKDPWFIDRTSIEYLSGGALKSNSWTRSETNTGIVRITYSLSGGFTTDFVTSDIGKTVTSAAGDTGTLLDFNTTVSPKVAWIRPTNSTASNDWDSTSGEISVGSGTGNVNQASAALSGESVWSNIYSLGTLVSGTHLYVYQNDQVLRKYKDSANDWWDNGHIDILVTVKEVGSLVDGGNLTVLARKYSTLYDHYVINAQSGRNPVPLASFTDGNNQTAEGTVSGYSGITINFGASNKDIGDGNNDQPYDVVVDCGGHTVQELYEYLKYITRRTSTVSLNGVDGEYYVAVGSIRFNYINEVSGPFAEGNSITSSSGGSGYITSLIDNGSTGILVIRDVHGTFADTDTLTSSGTTATISGTPDDISPSKQSPFGTFAGGKFFGARGVWIENVYAGDANNYQLIDSNGITRTPPVTCATNITVKDLSTGLAVQNANVLIWVTDNANYFYQNSVSITGSGTTATVTHNNHGLTTGDYVIIEGVSNDDDYNGVFQVTVSDNNTYTYTASETLGASPATGTPISTFAIISGTTNASGQIGDSRNLSANQPVAGWARKSSSSPYYQQGVISGTIDKTNGLSVTVQLARDE